MNFSERVASPSPQPQPTYAMDSTAMGNRALPSMEKLGTRIPGLRSAVLCSADGFNLCSIGIDQQQVGKMAALASSLFTVGTAVLHGVQPAESPGEVDTVLISDEPWLVLGCKIPHRNVGHLVLLVAGDRGSMGTMLVGARATAREIEQAF